MALFKQIVKVVLFILAAIFVALFQLSLLKFLPFWLGSLNLILTLTLFICLLFNFYSGLWLALISGLVTEIYSPYLPGLLVASLLITLVLINFLFHLLFTNRSLYSLLILGIIGTIFFQTFVVVVSYLVYLVGLSDLAFGLNYDFVVRLFKEIVVNEIFLAALFLIVNLFTKKIKATFLSS